MRTNLATFAAFATIQLTSGKFLSDDSPIAYEEMTPDTLLPQGYWTSQTIPEEDVPVGHLSQGEALVQAPEAEFSKKAKEVFNKLNEASQGKRTLAKAIL